MVTAALTLNARTPAELDAVSEWVLDSWLDGPIGPVGEDGTVRLTVTKDPYETAAIDDIPAGALPAPRNHRVTRWYEEWERPLVECTLTVGSVEAIVEDLEFGEPVFQGVEFDPSSSVLKFDETLLELRVSLLDVRLEVRPDAVDWKLVRHWRVGPVVFDSGGPAGD